MDIIFNGVRERVPERTTISDLVVRTDEKDGGLIVEVNRRFVFPANYGKTFLSEGDTVEFINPDFGG
ncbi:MAG: sulfur carrier protein ThiS [Syntrophorhabdus sp. PtaB.Bin047]|jgi:thiamine biosynthesis protein ThiS|nr:MAG: sulfur carrier protein ThiS [Syntrophorhabdus sp. PtaB.Bin047]